MRRNPITFGLLILALATSASACVAELGVQPPNSCPTPRFLQAYVRKQLSCKVVVEPACGHRLKSLPANCGMRSFVQFQVAEFSRFELPAPLRPVPGNISMPIVSAIVLSSIGSPHTDRGPPNS